MEQKNTSPMCQDLNTPSGLMTQKNGCPVGHNKNSMTVGPMGPVVVQDLVLLEKVNHFVREKTPARNVHALGTGAYGTFTATGDVSKYTCAKIFKKGTKTDLFTRMSGTFTEQGEAETTRDPRGFAVKFYTTEGNWDLMCLNTPIFNVRDMKIGPDTVHAFKRDPRTGMWNPTQTWDYIVNHPESLHMITMLYTDRGTPASYRFMPGFGVHTFSFINEQKQKFWVKFHLVSQQGVANLNQKEAKILAGENPNFLSQDLRDNIENGNFPKWKLCCQIMSEEEGYKNPWTFDCTKVWKHDDYPLIELGILELNKNPIDYFSEVEQVCFSPTNMIPGIGLSPDKLLQGRLLTYDNAQFHRLGPNFEQLPINCPHATKARNMELGGNMNFEIKNRFPHYTGSIFGGYKADEKYLEPPMKVSQTGNEIRHYDMIQEGSDEDYYVQIRDFLKVLDTTQQNNLILNIVASIEKIPQQIQKQVILHYTKVDQGLGKMLQESLNTKLGGSMKQKNETEMTVDKIVSNLTAKSPVQSC